jgi:D-glycero-D-manno-heptose 1,7-bisphosphate phosphatase
MTGRRAVFLDRDGVVNRSDVVRGKPYAPRTLETFQLLPGVIKAVASFKEVGAAVVIVTNQPDIGNGLVALEVVEAMHDSLRKAMPSIDRIECCPHSQSDGCSCRKPKPGMFVTAAQALDVDLTKSVMVGDRASDIAAGKAAGCRTVFIDCGYREAKPEGPDVTAMSLPAAQAAILEMLASFS